MAIKLVKKEEEIRLLRSMTSEEKLQCINDLELNINHIGANLDHGDIKNVNRVMKASRGLITLRNKLDESASTKIDSTYFTNLTVDNRILVELLLDQRLLDLWDISRKTVQSLMSRKMALNEAISQITKIEEALGESLDDVNYDAVTQGSTNQLYGVIEADGRRSEVINIGVHGESQFSDSPKADSQYMPESDIVE